MDRELQELHDLTLRREREQQEIERRIRAVIPTDQQCADEPEDCLGDAGRHWIHGSAGRDGAITHVDVEISNLAIWIWEQYKRGPEA